MSLAPRPRRPAAVAAILRTELTLRVRDPAFIVLLALLLASCALLVPDPDAGYAIVMIDQHKPILSADTALVAAGIVLGVLLLPVYALALDVGHARDRRTRMDRLQLTAPVDPAVRQWARILASLIFVLLITLLALLFISSTVGARYRAAPAPPAMAIFLLIVGPVGMSAALLAAMLDRFLPERNVARTTLAFGAWIGTILLSLVWRSDLFGIGYLTRTVMPDDPTPAFSVGVIAARDVPSMLWKAAPLTASFAWERLGLALGLLAASAALALVLRPDPDAPPSAGAGRIGAVRTAAAVPGKRPGRLRAPATASAATAVRAMVAGWLRRSRVAPAAIALALALALWPGAAPGGALAVALVIPMAIISRTSVSEARVAATLEKTTAALLRPSPNLMFGWALALVAVAPVLPALARMRPIQAATAALGLLAAALWLTWTHRCVRRPLLGISTFAALWYFDAFNDVPPALDLLGLWHADGTALSVTALGAGGLICLVALHER